MEPAAQVIKPASDTRDYRHLRLDNGVRVLLVHDAEAVFAAAAANVQAGYFDDPPDVAGLAHYLEHAVHLGSAKYPDPKEYKTFLSQHGGASNASTGMAHTQFHMQVHSAQLCGALDRLAQLFAAPLLRPEDVLPEVENVHSEFSRNCNSDGRKLSQLKRSLCLPPYSQFSTGNITTLREAPRAAGRDVVALMRAYWERQYLAGALCVAVVAPHSLDELQGWATDAFGAVRVAPGLPPADGAPATPAAECVPLGDVVSPELRGRLVHVAPLRELRSLEVDWHIPYSVNRDARCKPWRWVSHLLGHEAEGSVAHSLKQQGLLQSLSAGIGEEARVGRGFMFFHVTLQLTERGMDAITHVLQTLFRGLQVVLATSEEERRAVYEEQRSLASLRFDWQDRQAPLDLAKDAAFRLHYWDAADVVAGPALMDHYDGEAIQRFLSHLTAEACNVYVSARRFSGAGAPLREQWYGAEYDVQPLPTALREALHTALTDPHQLAGQSLHLPGHNWALPVDLQLRPPPPAEAGAGQAAEDVTRPATVGSEAPSQPGGSAGSKPDDAPPPLMVEDVGGVRLWHQQDTAFGIPKAHVYAHLVTPEVYRSPKDWVVARLYVRIVDEVLQPLVYAAELAATRYSLSCHESGLQLHLQGFSSVARALLPVVLRAMAELSDQHVAQWYDVTSGQLRQSLQQWQHNNPSQHAEYGAEHALQPGRWHAMECLALLEDGQVGPADVSAFAARLCGGVSPLFVEMLAYGNVDSAEALGLAAAVRTALRPCGLAESEWPQAHVLHLASPPQPLAALHAATAAAPGLAAVPPLPAAGARVEDLQLDGSGSAGSGAPTVVVGAPDGSDSGGGGGSGGGEEQAAAAAGGLELVYAPDNPNPGNSNHGIFYLCQIGPDSPEDVRPAVLLALLARIASKPCFHQLRTQQRLGYVVSCSQHKLHRMLGLSVRIQSATHAPHLLRGRVRSWLLDFRGHLQGVSPEALVNFKLSMRERLTEPPRSLADAAGRAWGPVRHHGYDFGRRLLKVACLDTLRLQDLLEFYDSHLLPGAAGYRTLSCEVQGGAAAASAPSAVLPETPEAKLRGAVEEVRPIAAATPGTSQGALTAAVATAGGLPEAEGLKQGPSMEGSAGGTKRRRLEAAAVVGSGDDTAPQGGSAAEDIAQGGVAVPTPACMVPVMVVTTAGLSAFQQSQPTHCSGTGFQTWAQHIAKQHRL